MNEFVSVSPPELIEKELKTFFIEKLRSAT